MALSIHESMGQRREQPGETEYRETRFERSPWITITRSERKNPQVTMWMGARTIVLALSFPDDNAHDVRISITGTCLEIRCAIRNNFVCQNIDFPCPVGAHPLRIQDGRGTHYMMKHAILRFGVFAIRFS